MTCKESYGIPGWLMFMLWVVGMILTIVSAPVGLCFLACLWGYVYLCDVRFHEQQDKLKKIPVRTE